MLLVSLAVTASSHPLALRICDGMAGAKGCCVTSPASDSPASPPRRRVECCVCMCDEDVSKIAKCTGAAHCVCGDCLAGKVATLAENRAAFNAAGDLKCRDCTGQACDGVFECTVVVEKLPEKGAIAMFFAAARRHAADVEREERAKELEELRRLAREGETKDSEKAVDAYRKLVEEELNVMRCPRCERPATVGDFQRCMALWCAPADGGCGVHLCGWCLEDCGEDAHAHVAGCARNPRRPNLFGREEEFRAQEREEHRRRVVAFQSERVPAHLRRGVWDQVSRLPAVREAGVRWADVQPAEVVVARADEPAGRGGQVRGNDRRTRAAAGKQAAVPAIDCCTMHSIGSQGAAAARLERHGAWCPLLQGNRIGDEGLQAPMQRWPSAGQRVALIVSALVSLAGE